MPPPPNQPATPFIGFRGSDEMREALERIAKDRGETLSDTIRYACWELIRRYPMGEV